MILSFFMTLSLMVSDFVHKGHFIKKTKADNKNIYHSKNLFYQ